jgi:coproporphyrinogen III oxidase-like Fe-S oxidoreductase
VVKGHSQTGLDKVWKTHIMELMCHQTTRFIQGDENWIRASEELREMESEGLVSILKNQIQITRQNKKTSSRLDKLSIQRSLHLIQ